MTFQDFCSDQCQRMSRLNYFPRGDDRADSIARGEIVRALMRTAQSESHAEAIVSRILEVRRECPTPLDVDEIAAQVAVQRSEQGTASHGECPLCKNTPGWAHTVRMVDGVPYHFSSRCSCPIGRRGAALEHEANKGKRAG